MVDKKIIYFDFNSDSHNQAIESFTVSAGGGLVNESSCESGGVVAVQLSGGRAGMHRVTCGIVTRDGRTARKSLMVRVGA